MNKGGKIAFFFGTAAVIGGSIYLYLKKKNEETKEKNQQLSDEKARKIDAFAQEKAEEILTQSLTPLRKNRCGMVGTVNTPTDSGRKYVGIHPKLSTSSRRRFKERRHSKNTEY